MVKGKDMSRGNLLGLSATSKKLKAKAEAKAKKKATPSQRELTVKDLRDINRHIKKVKDELTAHASRMADIHSRHDERHNALVNTNREIVKRIDALERAHMLGTGVDVQQHSSEPQQSE